MSVSSLVQCVNPIRWRGEEPVLPKRDCGDYSVGAHLFPFRTEKLSPTAPMVLPYRWESRSSPNTIALSLLAGLFYFKSREDASRPAGSPTRQSTQFPTRQGAHIPKPARARIFVRANHHSPLQSMVFTLSSTILSPLSHPPEN